MDPNARNDYSPGPDMRIVEEALVDAGVEYDVLPKRYPVMGEALEKALDLLLKDNIKPETRDAWK